MKDGLGRIQTVLVVGGGSDIGQAIAGEAVSSLGATTVVLAGRRPDRFVEAEIGVTPDVVSFDAEDPAAHPTVVDDVFDRGDVDLVVLAAGVLRRESGVDTEAVDVRSMAATNYLGTLTAMMAAARRLRDQGHGHLVVLSSIASVRPRPDNYLYGSTKAGIDFAARGLAAELAEVGIPVTVVRPGFVRSKMTEGWKPAPLSTTPEAVARLVVETVRKGSGPTVVWAPPALRVLAFALRVLPIAILRKLRG